ncbi:MAG: hypothetical protein ABI151_13645, partial [Chitinophagaceae bacterium]
MRNYRCLLIALIAFTSGVSVYAQNPDRSVLDLWNKNDVTFNSPKTGNPLLPGYFADPTIIEDNGTYYIYATSDM